MKYIVTIFAALSVLSLWIWHAADRVTACWIEVTNKTDTTALLNLYTEPDAGTSFHILHRNRPKKIRLHYPVETKVYFEYRGKTFIVFDQCASLGEEVKLKFKSDGIVEIRDWWR